MTPRIRLHGWLAGVGDGDAHHGERARVDILLVGGEFGSAAPHLHATAQAHEPRGFEARFGGLVAAPHEQLWHRARIAADGVAAHAEFAEHAGDDAWVEARIVGGVGIVLLREFGERIGGPLQFGVAAALLDAPQLHQQRGRRVAQPQHDEFAEGLR